MCGKTQSIRNQPAGSVWLRWLVAFCLGGLPYAACSAPPTVSQYIGTESPIVDEFGDLLLGTAPDSGDYGIPPVEGDFVQIFHAVDNVIHPPAADGTPHPHNVLLATSRIGWGLSPVLDRPAKFSAAIAPRPEGGAKIFVRVFNAPSLEKATFYGDSQLYTVVSTQFEVFMAEVGSTSTPLDPDDSDGDGISNSWEASYTADNDNDGILNEEETLAGTRLDDPHSYLGFSRVAPTATGELVLEWPSVAGKTYVVEAADAASATDINRFETVGQLTATGPHSKFVIPNAFVKRAGCYRVCVITSE